VTYDENGGFFDHVAPVTAPPGTAGEYVTSAAVPDPTVQGGVSGPIGLGFRVPTFVISPFSRGGFVCSDQLDHTSLLRFLETRFGAEVPNLSAWRRANVGDMTTAFNFSKPDTSIPSLPSPVAALPSAITQCDNNLLGFTAYQLPATQAMPGQEAGTAIRPSSVC
jgi:phospholipase C